MGQFSPGSGPRQWLSWSALTSTNSLSSTARPLNGAIYRRQGLLTCTHTSRTSSTVLLSQEVGPTNPNAADCEGLAHQSLCHQDQLHYVAQLRCRACSPSATASNGAGIGLMTLGPATSFALRVVHLSSTPLQPVLGLLCCPGKVLQLLRGRDSAPKLMTSGQLS